MTEGVKNEILIVEDDAAIRRLVTMILKREGFVVDIAVDGLEAVLKLGVREYDVIVLDLMMPNLDGFTFLAQMDENRPEFLQKIIVTSAASPAVIRARLVREPFRLLPKPFELQDLVVAVRECIAAQSTGT